MPATSDEFLAGLALPPAGVPQAHKVSILPASQEAGTAATSAGLQSGEEPAAEGSAVEVRVQGLRALGA